MVRIAQYQRRMVQNGDARIGKIDSKGDNNVTLKGIAMIWKSGGAPAGSIGYVLETLGSNS